MTTSIRKKQLIRFAAAAASACLLGGCTTGNRTADPRSNHADPNDYSGSDSERINAAIRDAGKYGHLFIIRVDDQRTFTAVNGRRDVVMAVAASQHKANRCGFKYVLEYVVHHWSLSSKAFI